MPTHRQPVSMEAIEAIDINLSNFDVTIAGAAGANVNAVTKSGTNSSMARCSARTVMATGSAMIRMASRSPASTKEETYGFTLGGPIIKDRLFFFANYEKYKQAAPGTDLSTTALGKANAVITQTDVARAQRSRAAHGVSMPETLESKGDIDLEEYALKLDWNITDTHRASFRYSHLDQTKLRINGLASSSVSLNSYWYQHDKAIDSYVGQLFSDWSETFSTEFKVSFRDYSAIRTVPGNAPSVRIYFGGTPTAPSGDSLFLGTETNSQANELYTKTWNDFGAGTWTSGDHDVKFGFDCSRTTRSTTSMRRRPWAVYEFANLDKFAAGEWYRYNVRIPQPGLGIDSLLPTTPTRTWACSCRTSGMSTAT